MKNHKMIQNKLFKILVGCLFDFSHYSFSHKIENVNYVKVQSQLLLLLHYWLFQIKLLEEKNTVLMQSSVSLEEELRKANAAKGQLETYKRQVPAPLLLSGGRVPDKRPHVLKGFLSSQVVELQNRLSEESKKADKMEFEYKRVKEKVDSLQKEKDVRLSPKECL